MYFTSILYVIDKNDIVSPISKRHTRKIVVKVWLPQSTAPAIAITSASAPLSIPKQQANSQ